MPFQVKCPRPACGQLHILDDSHRGRPFRCPACDTQFNIGMGDTQRGQPTAPPPVAFPSNRPQQIGRYRLLEQLGRGSFGSVHRAHDTELDRQVAIKVAHATTVDTPEEVARFKREAKAVARLKHPYIVPVYDSGQDGPHHYIVYDLIDGQSLEQILGGVPLVPQRAVRLVVQLAEALHYAHSQGVLHRDVKPSNVMVDRQDRPILVDFGLARLNNSSSVSRSDVGTLAYMAPELFDDKLGTPGPLCDLYSLAVTLHQLLTGRLPFSGDFNSVLMRICAELAPPIRSFRPELDAELEAICLKALSKCPEDRHPDCLALSRALRQWLTSQGSKAPPGKLTQRPTSNKLITETLEVPDDAPLMVSSNAQRSSGGTAPLSEPKPALPPTEPLSIPVTQVPAEVLASVSRSSRKPSPSLRWPRDRRLRIGLGAGLPVLLLLGWLLFGGWSKPAVDPLAGLVSFGPGKPHVLIVGLSGYEDDRIKPREHAEAEARSLYDLLTNERYLGVPSTHAQLLVGSEATRARVLEVLRRLSASARADDPIFLAFFGQGAPVSDRSDELGYLVYDTSASRRKETALSASDLQKVLDQLESRRVAVFVDVDFNSLAGSEEPLPTASLRDLPYQEFTGAVEGGENLPGRALFLASDGMSPLPPVRERSAFCQALLEGLQGAADTEGYEADGVITVNELFTHLEKQVPELIRAVGAPRVIRSQLPYLLNGESSNFPLTNNPRVAALASKRRERFETLAQQAGWKRELLDEGYELLGQMPKRLGQQHLRREYQKFVDGDLTADQLLSNRATLKREAVLSATEADRFASKILSATTIVLDNHVREVNRGDLVAAGIRGLYRHAEQNVPDELRKRLEQANKLSEADLKQLLIDARIRLGRREDLDQHKDLDAALYPLLKVPDSSSYYVSPAQVQAQRKTQSGSFSGVGIQVREDLTSGQLRVITPIRGGPSLAAGIQEGDLITAIIREVDSEGNHLDSPEETLTRGLPLDSAIKLMQGKEGTKVKLVVQRSGENATRTLEINRARIETETVFGVRRKPDRSWDYWLDKSEKIGYLRLSQLTLKASGELKQILQTLTTDGLRGLILDLRFNTGGYLSSSLEVADLFINDEVIVQLKSRSKVENKQGTTEGSFLGFPMVCLVNPSSASGTEIIAACLQDHQRAVIVGERTYGKADVQQQFDFDGGLLAVTTNLFCSPTGKTLNKPAKNESTNQEWGVSLDVKFALTARERAALNDHLNASETIYPEGRRVPTSKFEDRQLAIALDELRKALGQ